MRALRQSGFTYVGVLLLIAIMGAVLAGTATVWSHGVQREREVELLHIGNQFRRAIGLYYERTPGTVKRFPQSLDELLYDKRFLFTQRYLRRVYADPMTGRSEWGFVRAPDGGIMGVHSLSKAQPVKTAFSKNGNEAFADAQTYLQWRFVYMPAVALPVQVGFPIVPRKP